MSEPFEPAGTEVVIGDDGEKTDAIGDNLLQATGDVPRRAGRTGGRALRAAEVRTGS